MINTGSYLGFMRHSLAVNYSMQVRVHIRNAICFGETGEEWCQPCKFQSIYRIPDEQSSQFPVALYEVVQDLATYLVTTQTPI